VTRFESLVPAADGLVVTVVQDATTHDVLMIGYSNAESLDATERTGVVHFWSRSRQSLWMKGETSGNHLRFESVAADCDRDALLMRATPTGPVCHLGSETCFGASRSAGLGAMVDRLIDVIDSRQGADPSSSYTARLLEGGDLVARKVIEEAGEVAFAAKDAWAGGERAPIASEAADLLYHLLVLLSASDVTPEAVGDEIRLRMGGGSVVGSDT
jgi:phosphoribosyl-AMP cyclohydrolase / phosphoribosyl-ATP pyrophosphohydrolase